LLDAATTVIRRQGSDPSMDEIAAEAGISKPILYRHFGDKAGLFDAIAERMVKQLRAAIEARTSDLDDARLATVIAVDAFVGLVQADPKIYRALRHHDVAGNPGPTGAGLAERAGDELGSQLARLLDRGGLDPEPARVWAFALVGMIQHSTDRWLDQGAEDREAFVAELGRLMWSGLAGAADPHRIG
jgi:AcrR family transcriptional regulator